MKTLLRRSILLLIGLLAPIAQAQNQSLDTPPAEEFVQSDTQPADDYASLDGTVREVSWRPTYVSSNSNYYLIERQNQDADARGTRVMLEGFVGLGLSVGNALLSSLLISSALQTAPAVVLLPLSILVLGSTIGVNVAGASLEGTGDFVISMLTSALGIIVPIAVGAIMLANGIRDLTPAPSGPSCCPRSELWPATS